MEDGENSHVAGYDNGVGVASQFRLLAYISEASRRSSEGGWAEM